MGVQELSQRGPHGGGKLAKDGSGQRLAVELLQQPSEDEVGPGEDDLALQQLCKAPEAF